MTNKTTKQTSPFGLRMSEAIKQWLSERAGEEGRSMNSEINQILKAEKARGEEEQKAA